MNILGHEKIVDFFRQAIEMDSLSHAYMFVGPEAVGKFHVARALSARMLCRGTAENSLFSGAEDQIQKPCWKCDACYSITKNIHPDLAVVEVEQKKHAISIEQIRSVLKGVYLTPVMGGRKIVIINNAHYMTISASNAFLKTLEEPPEASLIFLITHLPDALPQTILSRCQLLEFSKVQEGPADANKRMWQISQGLPGLFFSWLEEEANYKLWQNEIDEFLMFLAAGKGERLRIVDKWFKKDDKHADRKIEWSRRLELWQYLLRDIIMLQLDKKNLIAHPQIKDNIRLGTAAMQRAADYLHELALQIKQNINIRAQVESFAISL